MKSRIFAAVSLLLCALQSPAKTGGQNRTVGRFHPLATFTVPGEVAEIVAATEDGKTLIYTDSESEEIGFVDIRHPEAPGPAETLDVGGEPTSMAVLPGGRRALVCVHGNSADELLVIRLADRSIERRIPLGGRPDSVAVSPNGRWAAVAVENERDEDVADGAMPQDPPGFLAIVDLAGPVSSWTVRNVPLTALAERFPEDPEPEFVDINRDNIAAVTLQENNHVVLVDLREGRVVDHWSAGSTAHPADLADDGQVSFTDLLTDARREPDAIAWTRSGLLVTADEGDYDLDLAAGQFVGGRGFSIFTPEGDLVFESGASLEQAAAAEGLYPDSRSDSKGTEIEGIEIGVFQGRPFLFVGSERGNFVAVYHLLPECNPILIQLLETGDRPEGLLAIPHRSLFVSANEGDGTISIFEHRLP